MGSCPHVIFFLQKTLAPLLDKYFPFPHARGSQGRWEKRLRCHEQLSSWRLRAWWGLRHGWRTLSLTKSPPKTWARHEDNRSYQWNYSKWIIQIKDDTCIGNLEQDRNSAMEDVVNATKEPWNHGGDRQQMAKRVKIKQLLRKNPNLSQLQPIMTYIIHI